MAREIEITGIFLHANATACFHACRYCQLPGGKTRPAAFGRFAALVDRFLDWAAADGPQNFGIWPWYGNNDDCDRETRAGLRRIGERLGRNQDVVLLGGVAHRSPSEMRAWLQEWRELGVDTVATTFSGHGPDHDRWANKEGNYRFLLDTLHDAAGMGFRLQERILLIRNSLGRLEHLFDELDAIASPVPERFAIPLFYSGRARRLEGERLTARDFAALGPRITACLRQDHPQWRTEGKWVEQVKEAGESEPEQVDLVLRIDDESLDWAERRSCDEIVEALSARWRAAYRSLPSRRDLCEGQGDAGGDRIYMTIGQMERVWMDRRLRHGSADFDIQATHFY